MESRRRGTGEWRRRLIRRQRPARCVIASMPADSSRAVFLSYASQDAEAVQRIADALRAAGVEVWFDQGELVGGDAWDRKIRQQIKECALFVPVISANTQARRRVFSAGVETRGGSFAPDGAGPAVCVAGGDRPTRPMPRRGWRTSFARCSGRDCPAARRRKHSAPELIICLVAKGGTPLRGVRHPNYLRCPDGSESRR